MQGSSRATHVTKPAASARSDAVPFDPARSLVFAIGIGVPVVAAVALGMPPDRRIGEGFIVGAIAATIVSAIETWFRKPPSDGIEPLSEVLALWRGASNDVPYAVALAFAAAIAIIGATQIGTARPVWAL